MEWRLAEGCTLEGRGDQWRASRGVFHNDFDARHDREARFARRARLDGGLVVLSL